MRLENTYFEKISEAQLKNDELDYLYDEYKIIELPHRATSGSCGYDFYLPYDITLKPGETIKIPSLMRCSIMNGWFLMIVPRSSLGFKYRCQLDNTVGIIDSDYYGAKNEGHIWIKITNDGQKEMTVHKNEAICQGIFVPYGIVTEDHADGKRIGGFGSTNK